MPYICDHFLFRKIGKKLMKKAEVPVGQHYSVFLLTLNLYSSKERLPQIYYPGKKIQEPSHFPLL